MRIAIDWKRRGRTLAILIAFGSFLAFIDPYDATINLQPWGRWLYWVGLIIIGSLVGEASLWLVTKFLPPLHIMLQLLLISLAIALVITVVVVLVQSYIGPYVPVSYWITLYGLVWVISLALTGIGYLINRGFAHEDFVAQGAGDSARVFLERLPVKYHGSVLYAVSSEDHYLRVHTDRGEELILMRLIDAMRELAGADGLQTHRSWWVASKGVADTRRESGRTVLVLKSGAKAPVSRKFIKAVREKNLI
jgi:LytTr DNA-binding domain-containing protein